MKKLLIVLGVVLGVVLGLGGAVAAALPVYGELKAALFEKLSSSPTGTEGRVYYDTTEKKAKIYNGSAWQNVGSGSGSAGNLITNGDAEDAAVPSGWATYDEGSGAEPTDGTGDHADANAITAIARETGSGDLISGSASWKLVAGANSQGEGWAYSFTIPANSYLKNALNEISFGYYMSTAAASDLFRVYVYDVTNAALITPSFTSCGGGSTPSLTSMTTPCAAKLSWVATTGTSYRLLFHAASNTAATLYIDDLFVGQRGVQVGPGESPLQAISLTVKNGATINAATSASSAYYMRRIGEFMHLYVSWVASGATTGAGSFRFELPAGYTIDTSKLAAGTIVGEGLADDSGVPQNDSTVYSQILNTTQLALLYPGEYGEVSGGLVTDAAPFTIGNGDGFYFTAQIPIAEWAGGVAYGENAYEAACASGTWDDDSSTTQFGDAGCPMGGALGSGREKTITWQTPVSAGDRVQIWASKDRVNWLPINGARIGPSNSVIIPSVNAAGTNDSGVSWRPGASANQTIVRFAQYLWMANDDSPTTDWPSSQAYWVATKTKPGQPVGFGLASATEPGLLKHYEEGTFTPAAAFTGGNGTLSHSVQTGKYTRIGNVVYFTISLSFSKGTASNNMTVAGLPYTSAAGFPGYVLVGDYAGMQNSGWPVTGQVSASGTSIVMYKNNGTGGATNVTAAEIGASTTVEMSGWYFL